MRSKRFHVQIIPQDLCESGRKHELTNLYDLSACFIPRPYRQAGIAY